jgi:hypothetical protein
MPIAIETSIMRYIGSAAEVRGGALAALKPPLGSTFYCSDINVRYIYDGKEWSLLNPEAAAGAEHQVQLLIAILAELQALRAAVAQK